MSKLRWAKLGNGLYEASLDNGRYLIDRDSACDGTAQWAWLAQYRLDVNGDVEIYDLGCAPTLYEAKRMCESDYMEDGDE